MKQNLNVNGDALTVPMQKQLICWIYSRKALMPARRFS